MWDLLHQPCDLSAILDVPIVWSLLFCQIPLEPIWESIWWSFSRLIHSPRTIHRVKIWHNWLQIGVRLVSHIDAKAHTLEMVVFPLFKAPASRTSILCHIQCIGWSSRSKENLGKSQLTWSWLTRHAMIFAAHQLAFFQYFPLNLQLIIVNKFN